MLNARLPGDKGVRVELSEEHAGRCGFLEGGLALLTVVVHNDEGIHND